MYSLGEEMFLSFFFIYSYILYTDFFSSRIYLEKEEKRIERARPKDLFLAVSVEEGGEKRRKVNNRNFFLGK